MCQLLIKHMRQLASKLRSKSLQLYYFHFFLWLVQVKCTVHFPGGSQRLQPKSIPKQDLCCWVEKSICRKLFFRSQLLHSHIPHERQWILFTKVIHHSSCLVWKAAKLSLPPQRAAWSCSGTAAGRNHSCD